MTPGNRMTCRQMIRLADQVISTISSNKDLFPAPPVDLQKMQEKMLELYLALGEFSSLQTSMRRERMWNELTEELNALRAYVMEKKLNK